MNSGFHWPRRKYDRTMSIESVYSVPMTIQKDFHHRLGVRRLGEVPSTTLRGPPGRLVVGSGEATIRSRWRELMISRHTPEKEKRKGTPERMVTRAPPRRTSV